MKFMTAIFPLSAIFCVYSFRAMENRILQTPSPRIPLLTQRRILDSLQDSTLIMLAIGLLEQNKLVRAKHLINKAVDSANPDPQALYLCGLTVSSALLGYTPSLYMCGINCLEKSIGLLLPRQKEIIQTMIQNLQKHALQDEYILPKLQAKALRANCAQYRFNGSIIVQTSDKTIEQNPQTAYLLLSKLIEQYREIPDTSIAPWAIRACYALAMLEKARVVSSTSPSDAHCNYLAIAAEKQFEPAIWEVIRQKLEQERGKIEEFEKSYLPSRKAFSRMRRHASATITTEKISPIISDALIIIPFLENFARYVPKSKLFINALADTTSALRQIIKIPDNYQARCLLAITELLTTSYDCPDSAFAYLEPVITNPKAQLFFAQHCSQTIADFLKTTCQSNANASFMLGLIACKNPETRAQAFTYFTQGAKKHHFYSLCSAAALIKKGLIEETTADDAVLFYKAALAVAPTDYLKHCVLQSLQTMADNCASARGQYLVSLLTDQTQTHACHEIMDTIEKLDQQEFDLHIDYLKTHCKIELDRIAEMGNSIASLLLGYIHYAKASQSDTINLCELHTSLGKLRPYCSSPRSKNLAASIAYTLACHYQEANNQNNALRLFKIAATFGHPQAQRLCALKRLLQQTDSTNKQDMKCVIELADQGNLEAKKFLAKFFSKSILSQNITLVPQDIDRTYRYLEDIVSHDEADTTYHLLLAHLLCLARLPGSIELKNERAYTLFVHAINKGYSLTKQEHTLFGTLSFALHHDKESLHSLEQAEQSKSILWLRSLLYLRNPNAEPNIFTKVLDLLENILVIENDTLSLPQEAFSNWQVIYEVLKNNMTDNPRARELLIRLCYALGQDLIPIPDGTIIELIKSLRSTDSISTWSLLAFLHRQGRWVNKSLSEAMDYFKLIVNHEKPHPIFYQEAIGQLKILSNQKPCTHKETIFDENMICSLIARHFLVKIFYKDNPLYACICFSSAESIVTSGCTKEDRLMSLHNETGSLDCLTELAHQNNLDAAAAIIIFWGNRFLRNICSANEVKPWLDLCNNIISPYIEHFHDKVGQNSERDMLIAIACNLMGTLMIKIVDACNPQLPMRYFKFALSLDPTLEMAKYNIAYIHLHFSPSREERLQAIKMLRELADKNYPDACYELGMLYHPYTQRNDILPINPEKRLWQYYLTRAAQLGNPLASSALTVLPIGQKIKKGLMSKGVSVISDSTPSTCLLEKLLHTIRSENSLEIQLAQAITLEQWEHALTISDQIIEKDKSPLIALGAAEIELSKRNKINKATRYLLKAMELGDFRVKDFAEYFDNIVARIVADKSPQAQVAAKVIRTRIEQLEQARH